MNKYLLM
jgi:hypothetical protein